MRKIVFFFLMLTFSVSSFSQQIDPGSVLTKQDYLRKSKNQKITARVLLGGGSAMILTGLLINISDALVNIGDKPDSSKGLWLVYTGLATSISSIPFFVASGKSKKKAMSVSLKMQQGLQLQKTTLVKTPIPSLSFKINL